mmetsp:Transcript_16001/g.47507  ORF Transcript_16001/g.47507 Transcript_16001/m.47507 type:complete len:94 (-) Transcript_16001:353-634(-)|eukprot:217760-Chlamydomonas_euryale.AAC.3
MSILCQVNSPCYAKALVNLIKLEESTNLHGSLEATPLRCDISLIVSCICASDIDTLDRTAKHILNCHCRTAVAGFHVHSGWMMPMPQFKKEGF